MIKTLLSELQNAEFWAGVGFLIMILVFIRPLVRWLNRWGIKQAENVKKHFSEADGVREKASAFFKKIQRIFQNRARLKKQFLSEADAEIDFFEKETKRRLIDRMEHKKQESELHIKAIEENGKQDIKNRFLEQVVSEVKKDLKDKQSSGEIHENMDEVLQRVYKALDENKNNLKIS